MNGLANWRRLGSGLVLCFALTFLICAAFEGLSIPRISDFSSKSLGDFYGAFKHIDKAAAGALGVTGVILGVFAKVGWRWSTFRKFGIIRYPDLSGTWHGTSYPAQWNPFRSVVTIDHSFGGVRLTLLRNQSVGKTLAATLSRTDTDSVRLFNIYYNSFGEALTLRKIPAVDHGEDHTGTLILDLVGEESDPASWILRGQYMTNKRRGPGDDTKGTWGRMELRFQHRELAPTNLERLSIADKTWLLEETSVPLPRGSTEVTIPQK